MDLTVVPAVLSTKVNGVEILAHLIMRCAVIMKMEIGVLIINAVYITLHAVMIIKVLGVQQIILAVCMINNVVTPILFKDIGVKHLITVLHLPKSAVKIKLGNGVLFSESAQ